MFVVGSASLGAEIAAARLLAPYFGASTIIWANTIATVLVALSAGYAVGGRLADRRADLRGLCAIVLLASVLLAAVPFVADPFLRLSVNALGALSVGGFLGSLAAVLVLVAVPVMLLGAVAPYANRLTVQSVADTGRTTGNLYAISTAGSLVGTFLAALLLIPLIGTHRTFIVFALALALVAALGLGSARFLVVPAAVAASLAIPPAAIGAAVKGGRVIFSAETQYQYARVVQFRDGVRWLQLNEGVAVHSLYRPGSYLTGGYWDDFLVAPFAGRQPGRRAAPDRDPRRRRRHRGPRLRPLLPGHAGGRGRARRRADHDRPALLPSRRPAACTSTPPTRGRGCRPATPATTRSSSTPTASPTSRSTWSRTEFFASVRAHLRPGRDDDRQRRPPAGLRRAGEGGLGDAARGVPVRRPRPLQRRQLARAGLRRGRCRPRG